jgi:ketosteroid isomerase-like protein
MKSLNLTISLLLTAALFFAQSAHTHNQQKTLQSDPENFSGTESAAYHTVTSFHQALKTKDKQKAHSLLDEKVVIFEGGKVERSASEYASHHMQADMNYLSSVNTELLEQHVSEFGNVAISVARTKTTGEYKGKTINRTGMETMFLKKQNGVWKISHIHWSN